MGELLTQLFSSFDSVIEGLTSGIKNAFLNVIYVDPDSETRVISDFAKFIFWAFGITMAIGLVYAGVRMVKLKI